MRKLFIPPLTTALILAESWQFDLYAEYRNDSMFEFLSIDNTTIRDLYKHPTTKDRIAVMIPARSILKVKRIYIRQGSKNFDSVTFVMTHWAGEKIKGHGLVKFWAKLHDVNRMSIEDVPTEVKV